MSGSVFASRIAWRYATVGTVRARYGRGFCNNQATANESCLLVEFPPKAPAPDTQRLCPLTGEDWDGEGDVGGRRGGEC